ncbi:MAG TPA: hypothetical protein VJ201_07730 [Candidatus Babeliales bacterium]|nr:hypothetical protein [Candidatus Babeliales bacterium]HLC07011.1 hypothetical protein [Candidatus Babeliales bacterium]
MKKHIKFSGIIFFLLIGLCCRTEGVANIWRRGKEWLKNPFQYIKSKEKAILDNPYASTVAQVRLGNNLHSGELEYLKNRTPKVRSALEKILEISLENKYVPSISDQRLWEDKKRETKCKKYHRIAGFDFERCIKSGFCNTTNFHYSLRESRQVMDQVEFNVVANENEIIDAIRWVIEQKS